MSNDDRSAQAVPAVGSPVDRGVGRLVPERDDDDDDRPLWEVLDDECWRTCEDGCNGCDECTDYDDRDREPPAFGCCLPTGECCMPGLHFPSECHTAADYERQHGADWRETPNV